MRKRIKEKTSNYWKIQWCFICKLKSTDNISYIVKIIDNNYKSYHTVQEISTIIAVMRYHVIRYVERLSTFVQRLAVRGHERGNALWEASARRKNLNSPQCSTDVSHNKNWCGVNPNTFNNLGLLRVSHYIHYRVMKWWTHVCIVTPEQRTKLLQ